MSTVRPDHTKIVLPRCNPDNFWRIIHTHYAADEQKKWRYLAMLALRVNSNWSLDHIGLAFGHPKGHVARCLGMIKRDLRKRFRRPLAADEFFDDESLLDEHSNDSPGSPETRTL